MIDSQFKLEKLIGQGASSKVFMATNVKTDEKSAVKVIRFDKQQSITSGAMMLEIEYSRMKIFEDHPNIIKSYYCDSNGVLEMNGDCMGVMYNVIEFAENGSLANIIRHTGGLGEDIAKFYFTQICHAVNYIHFYGVAHMDIKLENILLDQYFNAKVADFGISVDVSQTNGHDNRIRGTHYYMAPEVASCTLTETYDAYKADVYSLGVLLHVMLYGEFPLRGDTETCSNYNSDSIKCRITNKLSNKRNINEELALGDLQNLLARMLSIDPFKRPCISEILECDWLKTNLNETLIQDVFEEMEQRKNFINEHHLSPN